MIRTATLVSTVLGAAPALWAQDAAAPQPQDQPQPLTFRDRFSIGGRLSLLPLSIMNKETIERSTSDPAVKTTTATEGAAPRVGGGISLQLAVSDHVSIGADLMYHRAGYDRTKTVVEGVDDTDTTADESTTTTDVENTRADFWDLPILLRFYNRGLRDEGPRMFFLAGPVFRRVSAVKTLREITLDDGRSDTYETPMTPANKNVFGVVVGAGLQLVDDVRFKFVPEIRYTRWARNVFDNPPTKSLKNQFEIVLGFMF